MRIHVAVVVLFAFAISAQPLTDQQRALLEKFPHLDPGRWQFTSVSDDMATLLDTHSGTRIGADGRNYHAWFVQLFDPHKPLKQPHRIGPRLVEFYDSLVYRMEFRCEDRLTRVLESTKYSGTIPVESFKLDPRDKEWDGVEPQTNNEETFEHACSYLDAKLSHTKSNKRKSNR